MYIRDNVVWFEEGDRVVLTHDHPDENETLVQGMMGVVVEDTAESPRTWVHVCWDAEIARGHDAGRPDKCPNGHGWNVDRGYLECVSFYDDADTDYDLEPEQELMSMLGVST